MIFIYLYFFLLGLVFGSFFNVVGLRVPMGQSIISPRSACPNCGHTLRTGELIPVLSYVIQGGKCRKCGVRISLIYPFFELLTGCLFVYAVYRIGINAELFLALTFISLLVIVVVSDLTYMIIPNRILLFFLPLFIVERFFNPLTPWWSSLVGALGAFLLLFLIAVVSKGGMGGGDVKLFGVLGYVIGWKLILLTFIIACFSGTIVGLAFMMAGKMQKRNPIPFGPFIAFGALVSYFYGDSLLNWYFSLIA